MALLKGIETCVRTRILHNVKVVQSRAGWTQADLTKAISDARAGIVYPIVQS